MIFRLKHDNIAFRVLAAGTHGSSHKSASESAKAALTALPDAYRASVKEKVVKLRK